MKRVLALPLLTLLMGSAACGKTQVVAEVTMVEDSIGQSIPLPEVPIQLLPYDRDAIFDSLEAAYGTPEPPIPPDLIAQRQQIVAAQQEQTELETRLQSLQDSLRVVSERTQQMQEQNLLDTPEYREVFETFSRLDREVESVKQAVDSAQARVTALQQATIARADSLRAVRDAWADEAFRDFQQVADAKIEQRGVEPVADTTNADGIAVFEVPEGQWWVYGRYALPYEELYWNEPIEVTGDSIHIELNEENAERRPVL